MMNKIGALNFVLFHSRVGSRPLWFRYCLCVMCINNTTDIVRVVRSVKGYHSFFEEINFLKLLFKCAYLGTPYFSFLDPRFLNVSGIGYVMRRGLKGRVFGAPEPRSPGAPEPRSPGALESRSPGIFAVELGAWNLFQPGQKFLAKRSPRVEL